MPENNPGNKDILFEASVDDRTVEFFQRFDQNLDRLSANAEQGFAQVDRSVNRVGDSVDNLAVTAEEGFDSMGRSIKRVGKEAGILSGIVGGITTTVINFGLRAVSSIKGFVSGSINLKARVDTLGVALAFVGGRAGYTAEQIAATEEEVKALGITTKSARESMLLMIRANIDWSEASHLAAIAQDAAGLAGINSSQAFERLVRGIQKQEPELLDELGIQLNRTAAYEAQAKVLGTTVKKLTDQQRSVAILNEIYRQAAPVLGTYGVLMGSVGKQMTSLPRLFEELQLSIGGAFQEALQAKVGFMTVRLKELNKWFEENQDTVEEFGHVVGSLASGLFLLLEGVLKFTVELPGKIKSAGISIAETINEIFGLISEEQLEENVSNLELNFKKAISLIATFAASGVSAIVNSLGWLVDSVKAFVSYIKGEKTWNEFGKAIDDSWQIHAENIVSTATNTFTNVSEALGLIEPAAEEAEDAVEAIGDQMQDTADDAAALEEALAEVNAAFEKLQKETEEKIELDIIRDAREQIERELQESYRREDIERNFQERIENIKVDAGDRSLDNFEDWVDRRKQAALEHSKRLLAVEKRYQERLRDLQEDFEFDAHELARKRDAVGLLALERRHKRDLRHAKTARDRDKEQANESYAEQLQALKESYDKFEEQITESINDQIEAAEKARVKEYEALERSLARQAEIRALHDQWEEEDRERELQKKLDDLFESFEEIEGLTASGLRSVIGEWEGFFGDLTTLYRDFISAQESMASQIAQNAAALPGYFQYNFAGSPGAPFPFAAPGQSRPGQGRYGRPGRGRAGESTGGENFGQAGQVSSLLANALSSVTPNITIPGGNLPQRLPSAPPQTIRKEIHVTADLTGVDPAMQRVVINTLMEIERNKGD